MPSSGATYLSADYHSRDLTL